MGAGQSARTRYDAQAKQLLQTRREAAILIQDLACQKEIAAATGEKNPQELADQIDQFFAKSKLENGFYDPEFIRSLSCMLRVGLTVDRQLTASKYVKDFFSDQRQIGALSVDGVAMISGMKGNRSMFVIKAPRNPKADNLVHEYFVAAGGAFSDLRGHPKTIIGTNWLRKVCLNYAQILGAFRCSPPEIDPLTKTLRDWCNTDTPSSFVNYVIYEKIDGRDLKKHCTDMDRTHFVTTMIQLAYALEIAQIYNGFTHYDLHNENVILRPVSSANPDEEALIPFVISEDLTVYVESSTIATIIDFGRCHIQTPAPAAELAGEATEHFGFFGLESYGQFANRARPYYDIYKILGFCLYDMAANQNPAFEECWPIMGFFGLRDRQAVIDWLVKNRPQNLFSLVDDVEKVGYCLTKDLEGQLVCLPEKASTLFDFLEYVEAQFPDIWRSKVKGYPVAGEKLLACGADCTNFAGSLQQLTQEKSTLGTPIGHLQALGDLRHVMRYRNNIHKRGVYFSETFPSSKYGSKLVKEVENLDREIIEAYDNVAPALEQQVMALGEDVKRKYQEINYPIVYSDQPSSDPAIFTQELLSLQGYLDRMQNFAKSFVEFREFYEAAEDMARIAGMDIDPRLRNYLESQISPLYQSYDNSRAEIRRILEGTPVTQEYVQFRQDLIVRTM